MPERGKVLEIGRGRIIREGSKIAILSLGTRLAEGVAGAEDLNGARLSTTVADARFAKPLDRDLIRRLAANHEVLITVEEGSIGGWRPCPAFARRRRTARRRPQRSAP